VRLTTSPPSCDECHGNLGHPLDQTGPVTGLLYLFIVALHELIWQIVFLRVYVSTTLKTILTAKEKACDFRFLHHAPHKAQVHKIQYYFTLCVSELMNHSSLIWTQNATVLLHFVLMLYIPQFAVQAAPTVCLEMSQM